MTDIQPIPQTFPLVDKDGFYTTYFKRFLDQVLTRIGGITGGTYDRLTPNSGSVVWDLNQKPVAVVVLDGPNTITPLNLTAGLTYKLTVVQPPAGGATITWAKPPFVFPGGIAPVLSTGGNALDEFWFSCDGTNLKLCVEALNFS